MFESCIKFYYIFDITQCSKRLTGQYLCADWLERFNRLVNDQLSRSQSPNHAHTEIGSEHRGAFKKLDTCC